MHNEWKHGPCLRLLAGACLVFAGSVASAQSYSRTETIVYSDNTTSWVLGQVASRTIDGVVAEQASYDPGSALLLHAWAFGKTTAVMTYNADGTLATSADGNGNQTTFSGWKRGIPQLVGYADGTSQSAIVGDQGWILQVTDQNGHATGFGYDAMGRLASINYPTGDTVAWNNLVQSFVQVDTSEYGIPAGHWRQTTTTGSHIKVSYFDALWRPLLVAEYDAADSSGTARFRGFEYDHQGRVVFASYPSAASNSDKGSWTAYDALGRLVSNALDSEQGLLTTSTSYLADSNGAYTLVRDPRGNEVRTWYQMFGEPTYAAPVRVQMPEGAVARIDRDVFGKPIAISRGNADGSQQVTRTYSYNGSQELCRTLEPETGATLMGYDGAGNLAWSAAGLAVSQACESAGNSIEVSSRKVGRTYDSRNRLKTLAFPDGNGNQVWTYTADGKPSQVVTQNAGGATQAINTYTYNKRGMLTAETSG
ncbi:RHS repeat protein [Stenotrophomonas maltophilia]|nr:RHS repeat protein [Stenotrophomonas maltophilia]